MHTPNRRIICLCVYAVKHSATNTHNKWHIFPQANYPKKTNETILKLTHLLLTLNHANQSLKSQGAAASI